MNVRRTSLQTTIGSRKGGKQWLWAGYLSLPLPTAKFWDGLLPKVNLMMCWLKFLSVTVEKRFSFEEFSFQTQLSFHMDELSPATNHETSSRSWAFKMPCCFGEGSASILLGHSPFSNLSKRVSAAGLQKNKLLESLPDPGWGTILSYTPLISFLLNIQ